MPAEVKVCKCGREFVITEGEKQFYKENGLFEPVRCPVCREKRKQKDYTYTCIDCGKEVTLSASNLLWYEEKGFEKPKRCKECSLRNRKILDDVKKLKENEK